MKHLRRTLILILGIILIIFCFVFRTWVISAIGSFINSLLFFDSSPTPSVTYGEFPICINYQVNNENVTLNDTVICEFDGFDVVGLNEKRRKWKSYLKSGKERLTLLKTENVEIYFWYGSAEYYMDDLRYQTIGEYKSLFEEYLTLIDSSGEETVTKTISLEEAEKLYDITIQNIDYSKPIENTFSTNATGNLHRD